MKGKKLFVWKSYRFLSVGILMMAVVGCGTVQHKLNFNEGYKPQQGTKIEVGGVVNETGQTFDIDIEAMLKEAITEALQNEKLICTGSEGHKLVLSSKIINYKKGDAFKRWLMPGWGGTELSVQCDLRDGDKSVGSAEAKRTVVAGGAYTIKEIKTKNGIEILHAPTHQELSTIVGASREAITRIFNVLKKNRNVIS